MNNECLEDKNVNGGMILIIDIEGRRLCNDNHWRDIACYGNVTGCVKEYKSLSHAYRRAKQIKGIVVKIPAGLSIDASGSVQEEIPVPERPGYVRCLNRSIFEYQIYDGRPGCDPLRKRATT